MYILEFQTHFDAAHFLPEHPKCGGIHGHRWEVKVQINTQELENGMVMDFGEIKEIIKELDHPNKPLNDIIGLFYPSAENISQWIHDKIYERLIKQSRAFSLQVKVNESPDSSITYNENHNLGDF